MREGLVTKVPSLAYSIALHVSATVTEVFVERVFQLFEVFSLQELLGD